MVRVTQLADDGTELAAVEVDDFTIEVIYAGLAELLRTAATARPTSSASPASACDLTRQAHQRRQRVLSRIRV